MKKLNKLNIIIDKLMKNKNINFGIVTEFKDGCATIVGLKNVLIGEKLEFLNSIGIASVLSIDKDNNIYSLVYKGGDSISQGSLVIKTGKTLDIILDWSVIGKIMRPF